MRLGDDTFAEPGRRGGRREGRRRRARSSTPTPPAATATSCLQHLGDDPDDRLDRPRGPAGRRVARVLDPVPATGTDDAVPAARRATARSPRECDGREFPPDGEGLPSYPVTVDADGQPRRRPQRRRPGHVHDRGLTTGRSRRPVNHRRRPSVSPERDDGGGTCSAQVHGPRRDAVLRWRQRRSPRPRWCWSGARRAGERGGGDWVVPAKDRYEAGQRVTMIGYGRGCRRRAAVPRPVLRLAARRSCGGGRRPRHVVAPGAGRPPIRPAGRRGHGRAPRRHRRAASGATHRASVTFDLPADLPAGRLRGAVLQRPVHRSRSRHFIGDLVHVGVDPDHPLVREWPLTDPAIRWLEDDALLALPSGGDRHRRRGPRRCGAGARPRGSPSRRRPRMRALHGRAHPAAGRRWPTSMRPSVPAGRAATPRTARLTRPPGGGEAPQGVPPPGGSAPRWTLLAAAGIAGMAWSATPAPADPAVTASGPEASGSDVVVLDSGDAACDRDRGHRSVRSVR